MPQFSFALKSFLISIILFTCTWYDTTHAHILTQAFNDWVLQSIYIAPPVTEHWQEIYYESLLSINALGSEIIVLLMLVTIFADLLSKKEYTLAIYSFSAVIAIFVITEICKTLIESPRPMFPLEHDSFPSGHTARVSAWCGVVLLLSQCKVYLLSRSWRVLLWIIPVLVAFTRLGLGRHWLSDVVAALALSVAVFLVTWQLLLHNQSRSR